MRGNSGYYETHQDLRMADSDIVPGWMWSVGPALQHPNMLFLVLV